MAVSPKQPQLGMSKLEDRIAPALFGQTWANPDNITFSIVADGTDVAGVPSNLRATLSSQMPEAVWTTQIQSALQAWSNSAGLDISQKIEIGSYPIGTADAALQNDPRFGDIRISARPLSDNVLAITNPPDLLSPWAGEIVLNSNKQFSADGANGTYQLYTVLLQETGHALGLDNNATDVASVMYENYTIAKTDIAPSDVTAIQALYGAKKNDPYEGSKGNDTAATAASLVFVSTASDLANGDQNNGQTVVAQSTLTVGDVDFYQFTQPKNQTTATINLSAGLSLLKPRVTVYDAAGTIVASAVSSANLNSIVLNLSNLTAGKAYSIKVDAEPGSPFKSGGYRIFVGATGVIPSTITSEKITSDGAAQSFVLGEDADKSTANSSSGKGSDDTLNTATVIGKIRTNQNLDARWDVTGVNQFGSATDTDVFQIKTDNNTPGVLHVAVWADQAIAPSVTVYDSKGNILKATVLRDSTNVNIVQIEGIQQNSKYYISFQAKQFGADATAKQYRFGIDFRSTPVTLSTIGNGVFTGTTSDVARDFTVTRSQLFRFELTTLSQVGDLNAYGQLVIRNSLGQTVVTLDASSGETTFTDILLDPGSYQVSVSGLTTDGRTVNKLNYSLSFTGLTDPIGPSLIDSTLSPSTGTTTTTPSTTNSTSTPIASSSTTTTTTSPTSTSPTTTQTPIISSGYVWGATWYTSAAASMLW